MDDHEGDEGASGSWKDPYGFERGFIRAEVVSYDDLIACGSHNAAKEKGLIRLEGKDYVVQDVISCCSALMYKGRGIEDARVY